MITTLRRTEPYKMLKRTTKPLRRRLPTEEGLAKSSKKQHSENRDIIVQELCESRGGRLGLSVLTSLLASVDVKIY